MDISLLIIQTLNGVQLGLLLFLVASGLTLVFGILDFVNLAHGSLYMLGAYFASTFFGLTGSLIVALVLMTRGSGGANRIGRAGQLGLLALVFLGQGGSMTCLRWVRYAGLEAQLVHVIMVTGGGAGLLGVLYLVARGIRPSALDLRTGAVIGVYNLVGLIVLLTALNRVPGTVFFPLMGCTVVLLDNLAAHFFWRERLDRWAFLGVGLALVAIAIVA